MVNPVRYCRGLFEPARLVGVLCVDGQHATLSTSIALCIGDAADRHG
jgi:hypothetical protein